MFEIRDENSIISRAWELKKLFPNYETKLPIWWERHK